MQTRVADSSPLSKVVHQLRTLCTNRRKPCDHEVLDDRQFCRRMRATYVAIRKAPLFKEALHAHASEKALHLF